MRSLNFDDGRKSFMVNDDPNRVIRFNPADPEIVNRLLDAEKKFREYETPEGIELNPDGSLKSGMEQFGAYIADFKKELKEVFNNIFNADVYDALFDGQSPLCIIGNNYLFMVVLDCLVDSMKPAFEEYAQKSREQMGKYLGDLSDDRAASADA